MKKIIVLLLVLMVFSISASAAFSEIEPFSNKAYINGYAGNLFKPQNQMTFAEAATVVARLSEGFDESGEYSTTMKFTSGWWDKYLTFLAQKGFLPERYNGFNPNRPITRGELAGLIFATGEYDVPEKIVSFPDVPKTDPDFDAIGACGALGLFGGYTDGTFRPDKNITRAEVVTVINRALGIEMTAEKVSSELNVFSDITTHWALSNIVVASNNNVVSEDAELKAVYDVGIEFSDIATGFDGKVNDFIVSGELESVLTGERVLFGSPYMSEGSAEYKYNYRYYSLLKNKDSYKYLIFQVENASEQASSIKISGFDMTKAKLRGVDGSVALAKTEDSYLILPENFDGYIIFDIENVKYSELSFDIITNASSAYIALDRIFMSNEIIEEKESGDEMQKKVEALDATMEKLLFTEPKVKYIPEFKPTAKGYEYIDAITFDGVGKNGQKTKAFAYIGFPDGASEEKPVPAVVLVHGGGGHAYLTWVQKWNKLGYAAIAIDLVGFFPTEVNADITEGPTKMAHGMSGVFLEDGYVNVPNNDGLYTSDKPLEEQWMYHAVGECILAHNILRADPRVDNSKIGTTGISWGGLIDAILVGHDPRFAFAIPVYGAGYQIAENENMAFRQKFDDEATYKLWAAERRFENAKMPIYWVAYNDDNNWTVIPQGLSYSDTVRYNDKTMIAYINNMGHSHGAGWAPQSIYSFADSIVKNGKSMVRFPETPEGREINLTLDNPDRQRLYNKAKIYYITEPMTVSKHAKRGTANYTYMDQIWQVKEIEIGQDGVIKGTVPEEAWGYYIEARFYIKGKACVTTTPWIQLGK